MGMGIDSKFDNDFMMNIPCLCDALLKSYKGYIRLAVMLIVIIVATINTITSTTNPNHHISVVPTLST